MDIDKKAYKISALGEFSAKNLEQEFFHDYMSKNMKYIRPIVLVFGIFNMLFIIPDYFLIKNRKAFLTILANRTVLLLLIMLFFFLIKRFKNYRLLSLWITIYEILASVSFLIIFGQYNKPNFLIQAFGVITVILVIFSVPNKWVYTLISSTFVSIAFFLFSHYTIKDIPVAEYTAAIVYILIALVLSGMGAFRSNYYHRKHYIYSKKLLNLSSTDQLTGIYNRAKWDLELKHWLAYSKRYNTPLSVIFFDIDDFKNINDAFGHLTGDKVIIEISEIVKKIIRESDVFARWGGDEFMLLLPNTNREEALNLAEQLRTSLEKHHFRKVERVTCSFGLALANKNDNVDSLVSRADKLLYASKLKGKNIVTS